MEDSLQKKLNRTAVWPFYLLIPAAAAAAAAFVWDKRAGIAAIAFCAVYLVFCLLWHARWKKGLGESILSRSDALKDLLRDQVTEFPLPFALLDAAGAYIWKNDDFTRIAGEAGDKDAELKQLFPKLSGMLPAPGEEVREQADIGGRAYRVNCRGLQSDAAAYSIWLTDVTQYRQMQNKLEEQKMTVGQIWVDNFEEVMNSTESVRQALLSAIIERKIHKYFNTCDCVIRKMERDKYFILIRQKDLAGREADNFSLLEEVKTVGIGNEIPVTLSMGFGEGGPSLAVNADYAQKSIDLALGRGGDQVVIRTPEKNRYYGGKSERHEPSTKVKARVKAQALKDLLATKDRVIIVGHLLPDCDSFGASIGIFCAVRTLGKKTSIMLDTITSSVRPLRALFPVGKDYPQDMFIGHEEAMKLIDDTATVVVVDTNRAAYVEYPEILEKATSIVLFDHHRLTGDTIKNATLSYIEPYASSTCEMVAEILQYFSEDVRLKPAEADALYAGIMIDTNNFMNRTGVRTFEAAAYLRRNGADTVRVRKLFRERLEDYQARAETLRSAEIFREAFAIGTCIGDGVENPTILGAQAANDLLNIIGVKASIVLTRYGEKIFISARSIDEINVQLIMERLGGGGHLTAAGTQLADCTVEEARHLVKETIDQMMAEGRL